jgi:hypothetical protein
MSPPGPAWKEPVMADDEHKNQIRRFLDTDFRIGPVTVNGALVVTLTVAIALAAAFITGLV